MPAQVTSGPQYTVEESNQVLARWIEENGYHTDGTAREVYLDYDPDLIANGVTELLGGTIERESSGADGAVDPLAQRSGFRQGSLRPAAR